MNPFKKFNTYLLENHPLLWHSKAIQLTLAGIFFWIVSYFIGSSLIDLEVLKHKHILDFYFDSYFIFFHIIYGIIIIFTWAFYFYKNNAFKSFYPLQKYYFTKLFFAVFIPILLLGTAYFPFTLGVKSKTSSFFTEKELKQDIDILNQGYVFLINKTDNHISNGVAYSKFDRILLNNNPNQYKREFQLDERNTSYEYANEPKNIYANKALDLIKKQEYYEIKNSIESFQKVCDKYSVKNSINSKHLIRYLQYKNFKNFYITIVGSSENLEAQKNAQNTINRIQSVLKDKNRMMKYMENQEVYFFDKYGLESIVTNFKKVKTTVFKNYILVPHLFIALFLAWLFMSFEFSSIKNILITIPILGIIVVVNVLIGIYWDMGFRNELVVFGSFIITFCICIITTLIGIKFNLLSKKILTIFMNLSYCFFPLVFIFVSYFMWRYLWGNYYNNDDVRVLLINPYLYFSYSLIGTLLFYPLLKRWKSAEE